MINSFEASSASPQTSQTVSNTNRYLRNTCLKWTSGFANLIRTWIRLNLTQPSVFYQGLLEKTVYSVKAFLILYKVFRMFAFRIRLKRGLSAPRRQIRWPFVKLLYSISTLFRRDIFHPHMHVYLYSKISSVLANLRDCLGTANAIFHSFGSQQQNSLLRPYNIL